MSDEESDRDIAGVPYLAVRAPKFRPSLVKNLFDALDKLASKVDEGRRNELQKKCRPQFERCPAKDGVPSSQPPPPYLPSDCYDARWLEENPIMEHLLQPAPAMGLGLIFEGQNNGQNN